MIAGRLRGWLFGLALAALTLVVAAPASPAIGSFDGLQGVERCLGSLGDGRAAAPMSCRVSYRLDEKGRLELSTLTAGALVGAECALAVDVAGDVVAAALGTPELFEAPPQTGSCRFETAADPVHINFLVAPKVWFEAGRAVRATPNVYDIRGLPMFLGDVLAEAINREPRIQALMLAEVNAFLEELGR